MCLLSFVTAPSNHKWNFIIHNLRYICSLLMLCNLNCRVRSSGETSVACPHQLHWTGQLGRNRHTGRNSASNPRFLSLDSPEPIAVGGIHFLVWTAGAGGMHLIAWTVWPEVRWYAETASGLNLRTQAQIWVEVRVLTRQLQSRHTTVVLAEGQLSSRQQRTSHLMETITDPLNKYHQNQPNVEKTC